MPRTMKAQQLEQLLHKEIPITKALAISIAHLSLNEIFVNAKFEANKNIHNTAFAGSIYTTATVAGWSLITNYLDEEQLPGAVVLASAEIKYKQPINGDIFAKCLLPQKAAMQEFKSRLQKKGRAKIQLQVSLIEDEQVKAVFDARFAVV